MTLDELQELWRQDSYIDPDNLHEESLKISKLHSKYYEIYNNLKILRESTRAKYNIVKLDRYNYYTGKADPKVYVEYPFPYKLREKDAIQRYMDADENLTKMLTKLKYYDIMIEFVVDIIKILSNRTYQIKNSIEFMRFTAGM